MVTKASNKGIGVNKSNYISVPDKRELLEWVELCKDWFAERTFDNGYYLIPEKLIPIVYEKGNGAKGKGANKYDFPVLCIIWGQYYKNIKGDKSTQNGIVSMSLDEFCDRFNTKDRKYLGKSLEILEERGLIICLNRGTRKGRAKYQYVPNIPVIVNELNKYNN